MGCFGNRISGQVESFLVIETDLINANKLLKLKLAEILLIMYLSGYIKTKLRSDYFNRPLFS